MPTNFGIGVSMHALRLLVPLVFVASLAAQNEVLYFKFEGGGNKALNYVPGSPAPGEGPVTNTLTTAPTSNFVNGPFGQALNSAPSTNEINYVDTGWAPSVTGDFTYAMWLGNLRGTPPPSGAVAYIAGIPVAFTFRIFTGGSILRTSGVGGSANYSTLANIYQMATAGGVHVAFVVDTVASTATYYINGIAEPPLALAAPPNLSGPTFLVGRQLYLTGFPNIYEIDEFRFLERAASPAEVAAWTSGDGAGAAEFGQGCGGASLSPNGLPVLGNLQYGLTASAAPGAVGIMTLGFSRTAAGPIALPTDLGSYLPALAGCLWECSPEANTLLVLDASGNGVLPFALPAVQAYAGIVVNVQGLFVGGPIGAMSTNPVGLVTGN